MNVISAFLTFSPLWSAKLINDSLKHIYEIPLNITKFGLYVQTMDELDDENILSVRIHCKREALMHQRN